MHTVIILSKHSSDLLRDFRFLFQPFIESDSISFCDWNESGTDIYSSVPDLYKLIKGRNEWRAVIVNAEAIYQRRKGFIPDEKNPFDYSSYLDEASLTKVSEIPLIRLTHILCGFPSTPVRNFEEGYEYIDKDTGEVKRVRKSELSSDELFLLLGKYKEEITSIYIREKTDPAIENAQKALVEQYEFSDVRPQEVYLVALRKHIDDESHIYESWKSPYEMESSDFCRRNNYPGICRFLSYSIVNPENSKYTKELIQFWLSILTLATNRIPASTLQAYKLYELGLEISKQELSTLLNKHLNKMEATLNYVNDRLNVRNDRVNDVYEHIVDRQVIPVVSNMDSPINLYIEPDFIGLCKDYPYNEVKVWNEAVNERKEQLIQYLKTPKRTIDKAAIHTKQRAKSFFLQEYELDRFQIEELKEELDILELDLLSQDIRNAIDEQHIYQEIHDVSKQINKELKARLSKRVVLTTAVFIMFLYILGYLPYIIQSFTKGYQSFISALGLLFITLIFIVLGGFITLLILKKQTIEKMEQYNDVIRDVISKVQGCERQFEQYFTTLCTYMKGQSIYEGIKSKKDKTSESFINLRTHREALKKSIERDQDIACSFGIRRNAEFEKNVIRFFDENKLPKENSLYYFDIDTSKSEIALNYTGDYIYAPYKFISRLTIERQDLYEEQEGRR